MTAAEFRVTREHLGLTAEWIADHLGVVDRTVRRWDQGASAVPAGVAEQMTKLATDTTSFVDQVVAALDEDLADREPDDDVVEVLTYLTDAGYRAEHPASPWPASWHRAAMGRVREQLPAIKLAFYEHVAAPGALDEAL